MTLLREAFMVVSVVTLKYKSASVSTRLAKFMNRRFTCLYRMVNDRFLNLCFFRYRMLGSKLRSWMEAVRPRKKQQRKEKQLKSNLTNPNGMIVPNSQSVHSARSSENEMLVSKFVMYLQITLIRQRKLSNSGKSSIYTRGIIDKFPP